MNKLLQTSPTIAGLTTSSEGEKSEFNFYPITRREIDSLRSLGSDARNLWSNL
jgi:hypothetical protein